MKLQEMNPDAPRPIHQIAMDISLKWDNPYFAAVPYLQAMHCIQNIDDMYGLDKARSVVVYFLSNATTFRGEDARRLKAELKDILK